MKLSKIQLVSDRIMKFEYWIDKDIENKKLRPVLNWTLKKDFKFDKDYRSLLAIDLDFKLKEGRKVYLKLNVSIEGEFIGHPDQSKKEFKEIVIKTGYLHLLQILRSKIVAITSLFGFTSPLYIPLLDIREDIEKILKELED